MSNLFEELKRRNVVRVGIAYLIMGWVIMQIVDVLAQTLVLPEWFGRAVLVLLLVGLPVALFFSWAFEMTSEGLKKTEEVDADASITHSTGHRLDRVIIVALVLALGYFGWDKFGSDHAPGAGNESLSAEASIAVLPFVNMSSDPEQEYFSDGISEEILNVLARIPNLKVAGRTSSFAFKGQNQDLRQIGQSLNVNHILEGSVRKSGRRLRITAQLVRSDDGFHLWSETYDRELADIFDIQDEISRAIADALAVSLGLSDGSLVVDRTEDIEAYEKYMRAHQLFLDRGAANLRLAILLFSEVTARDSNFAPAWSGLAAVYSVFSFYETQLSPEEEEQWRALGLAAARKAISLNPKLGEAYVNLASLYTDSYDWTPVFEALDQALLLAPNNASVLDTSSQIYTMAGYFEKAEALSKRATEIDPMVAIFWTSRGIAQGAMGQIHEARASYQRAIEIDPTLPFPQLNLFFSYMAETDIDAARTVFDRASKANFFDQAHNDWYNEFLATYPDRDALRLLRDKVTHPFTRHFFSFLIEDWDDALADLVEFWESEDRFYPFLFAPLGGAANHPRWKEQISKDGILRLWQTRGFPSQCRALGDDDFECDAPGNRE